MYADYEPIGVEFINGYLAPLSLLMDYLTNEVGFTYFFRELPTDNETPLVEKVREELRDSIVAFNRINRREFAMEQFDRLLRDECWLDPLPLWQTEIAKKLDPWMGKPIAEGMKKTRAESVWPSTFIADDFADLLVQFFGSRPVACFTLEGGVKSELYIHWGGLAYDDFFFDAGDVQYHLHFDLCD